MKIPHSFSFWNRLVSEWILFRTNRNIHHFTKAPGLWAQHRISFRKGKCICRGRKGTYISFFLPSKTHFEILYKSTSPSYIVFGGWDNMRAQTVSFRLLFGFWNCHTTTTNTDFHFLEYIVSTISSYQTWIRSMDGHKNEKFEFNLVYTWRLDGSVI